MINKQIPIRNMRDFGNYLEFCRFQLGFKQYQMAEFLGIDKYLYCRLERGRYHFSISFSKVLEIFMKLSDGIRVYDNTFIYQKGGINNETK